MAANTSVFHAVPIIIQPQTLSCWYTSFQMVVKYQRGRGQSGTLVDPSEDEETKKLYAGNKRIGATDVNERERIAKKLGFQVAFSSLTADGMWELLSAAPVIYAGKWPGQSSGHWIVLVGISEDTIAVNNPLTGRETYDYNWFVTNYLEQTAERPLIYP